MRSLRAGDVCRDDLPRVAAGVMAGECARELQRRGAALAVVLREERPVGLLPLHAVLLAASDAAVESLCNDRPAPVVSEDALLEDLLQAALDGPSERVLVVAADGAYRGAVAPQDLLRVLHAPLDDAEGADPTAGSRAEQSLAESEERYRRLVELCPDGIIMHREGRFIFLNPAAVRLLGAERDEQWLGRPILDSVHPDYVEQVKQRVGRIQDARDTVELVEERLVRLDGQVIDAEVTGTPIVLDDRPAVLTVFRDVTARKRAEEALHRAYENLETRVQQRTAELAAANAALKTSQSRLQKLIEQSPISTQIVAPDGRVIGVNRAYEQLWGVTLDDLRDYNLLRDPQLIEGGILSHAERALRGETVVLHEVPYVPDRGVQRGQTRWTNARIYPITDEAGRVCEVVILFEDVTDRKLAEDEVLQLSRRLEQASRLSVMGEMAAGIAHELHQPLQVIANYANGCARRLAAGEVPDDAFRETLHEIANEAVHAGRVVRRIKLLIQQREPSRALVDLNEIVRDVVRLARSTLSENGITWHVEPSPEPAVVLADGVAVTQAVLNLVLNAIDAVRHAERRDVTIAAACRQHEECEVSVADTGAGIPDAIRERVFDQFFTTKQDGLGLGLAISRSIAEAHHGRLRFESVPGEGTVFRLTLPTAASD